MSVDNSLIDELEQVSLFHGLSVQQLEDVSQFCTLLYLADGDTLIEESASGAVDLYLLCKGSVEIVSNATSQTSDEVVISKQENDVFGEMAWLTRSPRTVSVRCCGAVQAICVDGEALRKYLDKHTEVGYIVMREIALTLARRMNDADSLLKLMLWNKTL